MRGPIYPKFAAVLGLVTITGCAAGVDPGPNPETGSVGRPTETLSSPAGDMEHQKQIVDSRPVGREDTIGEVYRDMSAFVYRDQYNHQILQQWLVDDTGTLYWRRECKVADKGGVQWNNCTSWDLPHDVSDLGLAGFGPIAGMNTYVWTETSGAQHWQHLAQTVFNERGDQRMGRVCPIERTVLWDQCSPWDKLAIETQQLDVPGALSLRDDFYFSYVNLDNENVLVQNVLSIDGSLMWDRQCVSTFGAPYVLSSRCGFGSNAPLRDFGIKMAAIAGGGQYVYQDGSNQLLAQTFISVDGTKSYHRTCTVTPKGVEWDSCEPFTASTVTQLRVTQAPL